ncbi:MAG: aspartate kinase [Bacillota bacterium]
MPVIVQKFGGTSVSTPESREAAVARVVQARQQGFQPVVVVSAMGRNGDPYATDTLIGLGRNNLEGRELDLIMACGEIIASAVFVSTLRQHIPRVAMLTGWQAGILTDGRHGDARIVDVQADRVSSLLSEGYSVVVAGFQGMSLRGEITTLGRGGSDTTAAAMGVALSAAAVEIYTDVDGIMTADPRLVPEARVLPLMDYSEVLQMAYEGAKVLHPRAVEMAMQKNIPLLVKRTAGNHPGTRVVSTVLYEGQRRQPVVGIAYQPNITQFQVLPEASMPSMDADFFDRLAEAGISVDLINVSPDRKLFTVRDEQAEAVQQLLKQVPVRAQARNGCATVSVIGIGMRGVHGVMARVVRALVSAGVEILQTSDSHLSITCLISQSGLTKAANALHQSFDLASLER